LVGAIAGFVTHGIGGAIVGAPIFALLFVFLAGMLRFVLLAAVIFGLFWLLAHSWDLGRP
jgi:hypothetical protein